MNTNTFKKGEQLSKMIVLATNRHDGQFDRGGNPYILHTLAVMLMNPNFDEEQKCIAVGHDLIEDTKTTYKELRDMGFTARVIEGIRCLTKVPGETYEEYIERVKSNRDAVLVKLCDLQHNTDIRRLKGVSRKDMERTERYYHFYLELQAIINQTENK